MELPTVADIADHLDLMNPGGNNPNRHQIELVLMSVKELVK